MIFFDKLLALLISEARFEVEVILEVESEVTHFGRILFLLPHLTSELLSKVRNDIDLWRSKLRSIFC